MDNLYLKINEAQEDLNALRKKCPHTFQRIGYYTWGPGRLDLAAICEHCDEYIRTANIEEINAFNKS